MRSFALVLILLAAVLPFGGANAATFNVELDQQTIQEVLATAFPVQQDEAFVTVQLSQPRVILKEGSDRIGVQTMIKVSLPMSSPVSGSAYVDGKLRFDDKSNALYLDQAMVRDLVIEGMPDMARQQVINIANTVVRSLLDKQPIYVFKDDNVSGLPIHKQINRIEVKNGKLVIEISAY